MRTHKETAVRLVPKEHHQFLKDDNGFVRHIVRDISKNLAERVISILYEEGEIIVRLFDLHVEEQKMLNQVEYRQIIMWTPLVRCKNCENWECDWSSCADGNKHYCVLIDGFTVADFYCGYGERKDGADDVND